MSSSPKLRRQAARRGLSPPPSLLEPVPEPADSVVAVPDAQDPGAEGCPQEEGAPARLQEQAQAATPNGPRRVRRPWARQSAGAGVKPQRNFCAHC